MVRRVTPLFIEVPVDGMGLEGVKARPRLYPGADYRCVIGW